MMTVWEPDIPISVRSILGIEIWLNFAGSGAQVTGNMNNSFATSGKCLCAEV